MITKYLRALLLPAILFSAAHATAVNTVWTHTTASGHIASSPAVGDLTGDGIDDLVVTDTGGNITALNGSGQVLWKRHIVGPITISPTLADVCPSEADTGTSPLELLVVNGDGQIHCLDANTGRRIWLHALPHTVDWGKTSIMVDDLDRDGAPEIVTGDTAGTVVCLSGEGELLWSYGNTLGNVLCPASGDLDGDGMKEVLIAGDKSALICLSHDGKEQWRLGDDTTGASAVVWNLDGDAGQEIIAAIGKELTVVNSDGAIRWKYMMKSEVDSAITVADADADRVPEIYAVDLSGTLVCLAADGSLRWSGNVGQRARRSPSVGDVDGDGAMEILVAGYSSAIHVFKADGTLLEQIPLPAASNATATLLKVGTGDPSSWRVGVVCPTQDGTISAYQWANAPEKLNAPWPAYRMNAARTPSSEAATALAKVVDVDLGTTAKSGNVYRVRVANPNRLRLTVDLDVQTGAKRGKHRSRVSSEELIECSVPYRISGERLQFTCVVKDGETIVARQHSRADVNPFAQSFAKADRLFAELDKNVPQLADPSTAEERLAFLKSTVQRARDHIASHGAVTVRENGPLDEALDDSLKAARKLSVIVTAAIAAKPMAQGSLLLCAANPWAPFGGIDEAAEGRTPPAKLTVEAFGGEIEAAALNVFNFGGKTQTFRVELTPIAKGSAPANAFKASDIVTLHEAIEVPTNVLEYPSADALPTLNQAMTIAVPPMSARQLWLNVNVASLSPGQWSTTVRLRSLEAESKELKASLDITVWDAALPKKQPLSLCHWAHVEGSYLKEHPNAALQDQIDHGTNVFVCSFPPVANFNEQGEIVGEIDFKAHDEYVRKHAPHGIILFGGYQGGLRGPGGTEGPAYEKAHAHWLRAWVKHLKELGIDYDNYALYPIDEIGLYPGLVQSYLRYARLARTADPKVQIYTDPTIGVSDEEFKELVPFVDIWCPNAAGYLFDRNASQLDFIKSTGKTVWTYECFGVAKHQNPLTYHRAFAWRAWHHGLTGIGFWTYCTSPDDPWFVPRASNEWTMVYGGNGVVTSKRWEAVRDGIEDYSMLSVLRDTLSANNARQKFPDAASTADRVLGEKATAISEYTNFLEWDVKPKPDGHAERRRQSDDQWRSYQSIRAEVAQLLATMKN